MVSSIVARSWRRFASMSSLALAICAQPAQADQGQVAVVQMPSGYAYGELVGGQPNDVPRRLVAQSFYQAHSDSYDFLVVLPTFPVNLDDHGATAIGLHWMVKNDVSGIGGPVRDGSALFGSSGRLKGYIDAFALVPGVGDGSLQSTLGVLAHETLHQWAAYTTFRDTQSGQASNALSGRDGGHWSFFLDSNGSVLYGSHWQDNGDGTFTSVESRKRYSDLDLYLMGFLAPQQVANLNLLTPTATTSFTAQDLPPPVGTTIRATARKIGIADIVAAQGPRIPAADAAPHTFRTAFVVLAPPGQTPSPDQIAFVEQVRRAWSDQFFFLTRGLGVMETHLVEAPISSTGNSSGSVDVSPNVSFLLSAQQSNGSWADAPETAFRDTQVAIEALAPFQSDPRVVAAFASAKAFLQGASPLDSDSVARKQVSLLTLQAPSTAPPPPPTLAGLSLGYSPSVLDTTLLIQGSGASLQPGPLQTFLLLKQNADGGWPLGDVGPSRIESTTAVLSLLARAPSSPTLSWAIQQGLSFLKGRRLTDGSYADGEETAATTASALAALASARQLDPQAALATINWLLAREENQHDWDGSVYQTATATKALALVGLPNLSLSSADIDLSSAQVVAGEQVTALVTVHNTGLFTSPATSVQLFDSAGSPFGAALSVQALAAGNAAALSLLIDTTGHAGSTQLFAVIDPAGQLTESNRADNRAAVPLAIGPTPSQGYLAVLAGSLAVTPLSISSLPTALQVTANVANLGGTALGNVSVALGTASNHAAIGPAVSITLPAHSVIQVTLTGTLASAPQSFVQLEINAADTTGLSANPRASQTTTIPVQPVTDFALSSLSAASTSLNQGQTLNFTAQLANKGTINGQAALLASVIDVQSGQTVATVPMAPVFLPAGQATSIASSWKANVWGQLKLVLQAQASGDPTPGDDLAALTFSVQASSLPNLTLGPGSLSLSPNPPLQGQVATITATVRNTGGAAAGSFYVDFYLGDPAQGGKQIAHQAVGGLAAGASTALQAQFTPTTGAQSLVYVAADATNAITELDKSDNVAVLAFAATSLPDLVLGDGDVSLSSQAPRQGDTVQATITVHNNGSQVSQSTLVELFLGGLPSVGGSLVGTVNIAALPGNSTTQVGLPWAVGGDLGQKVLVACVNRSQSAPESDYSNNCGRQRAQVQDADFAVSEPYFSPNGDGIKDFTTLYYRQSVPQALTVEAVAPSGAIVRRIQAPAQATGAVAWDGTDDKGSVVADGVYRLRLAGQGASAPALTVVVDTNKSPLTGAGADSLEATDLGTPVGVANFLVSAADGSAVIYKPIDVNGNCAQFYVRPIGGAAAQLDLGTQLNSCLTAASDSRSDGAVLLLTPSAGLALYSLNTGAVTQLSHSLDFGPLDIGAPPAFSADGNSIAASNGFRNEVVIFDASDATAPRVVFHADPAEYVTDLAFSPDGTMLAVEEQVFRRIYLVDLGSGQSVRVVDGRNVGWSYYVDRSAWPGHTLTWAPNGMQLHYTDLDGIHSIELSGKATGVVAQLENGLTKRWSGLFDSDPNLGGNIVYAPEDAVGAPELWIASSGSAPRRLLRPQFVPPAWAPDREPVLGMQFSHDGSLLAYQDAQWGLSSGFIRSLANLTAELTASRPSGSVGLEFRGTATDLNFDRYEISARPIDGSAPATVAVSSTSAVVKGRLGTWTPAAPGSYEIHLTAWDKAGNQRSASAVVGWSNTPALASLAESPSYISLNPASKQNVARISYVLNQPLTFEIDILDTRGALVRHWSETRTSVGIYATAWDGRDDNSSVVADGAYTIRAEGQQAIVVVHSTSPEVSLAASVLPMFSSDGAGWYVPNQLAPWLMVRGRYNSNIPANWLLREQYASTVTAIAPPNPSPADDIQLRGDQGDFAQFSLSATDAAGNAALAQADVPEVAEVQAGFLETTAGLHDLDPKAAKFVPGRYLFTFATTTRTPITGIMVSYRSRMSSAYQAGLAFVPDVSVQALGTAVGWDASAVAEGPQYDVRFQISTQGGKTYETHYAFIVPRTSFCVEDNATLDLESGMPGSVSLSSQSTAQSADLPLIPANLSYGASLPASRVPGCALNASFDDTSGKSLSSDVIHVCGVKVVGAEALDPFSVSVRIAGYFGGIPASSVDVLVANDTSVSWQSLGSFASVSAPATQTFPFNGAPGTSWKLRLVAHLADGSTFDSTEQEFRSCSSGNPRFKVPSDQLVIGDPVRQGAAISACVRSQPIYAIPISASSPGSRIRQLAAQLQTPAGVIVAPLSTQPFQPGASVKTNAFFDANSVPAGAYAIHAEATDETGAVAQATRTTPIYVDQSVAPAIQITSPGSGALVCAQQHLASNGSLSRTLSVSGSVSPTHLTGYKLLLGPAGGALAPAVEQSLSGAQQGLSGHLADIDVSTLPAGDYQLVLDARDFVGSTCSAPAAFHLEGALSMGGLSATPAIFAPDGSGTVASTNLAYQLGADAQTTISLLDPPKGAPAITLQQLAGKAGLNQAPWTGSANGSPLPDGNYHLQVSAQDSCQNRASDTTLVTLDTTPPVARIDVPLPGASISAAAAISGEASDANFKDYLLEVGAGTAPTSWTALASGKSPVNSAALGTLGTGGLAPGAYTIRLTVDDLAGHTSKATVPVNVINGKLISSFAVAPVLVAPGVPGAKQGATAQVGLFATAAVDLLIQDKAGNTVGAVLSASTLPAGQSPVLLDSTLAKLQDGDYLALVRAGSESALAPVAVDRVPPSVVVASPSSGGYVPGNVDVVAAISDPHLTSWSVTRQGPSDPAPAQLVSGTATAKGTIARLRDLADGAHTLVFQATDGAGNNTSQALHFTSDATPPQVSFVTPLAGSFLSGKSGQVPVHVALAEQNPKQINLEVRGVDGSLRRLYQGAYPNDGVLTHWDVASEQDGPVTLLVTAEDLAGNRGYAQISVTVDNTPPVAHVDSPRARYVSVAPLSISGTAQDQNLATYTLSLSGGPGQAGTPIATGSTSVVSAALATLPMLPADGAYSLQLNVVDQAGNEATDNASFNVETVPPQSAADLVATVRNGRDVALTWSPSPSPQVSLYILTRGYPGGPMTALATVPVNGPLTYLDTGRPDGLYEYDLVAADRSGLQSPPASATATISANPPFVALSSPAQGRLVGNSLRVVGTAQKRQGFKEWRLSLGAGAAPASFNVIARSPAPAVNQLLTTLDASTLPDGSTQTLRLEGEDGGGHIGVATTSFVVDHSPPANPVLISANPSGANVTVTWRANTEPDLAGYLLLRNGAPVTGQGSDLMGLLLPPSTTSYVDASLPNGTFTYQLQAADRAGNLSGLSNALSVTLKTHTSFARIESPSPLARLPGLTQVVARVDDLDVASVQFQVRAGTADFKALGAPVSGYPYVVALDPATLASSVIELRAVATDPTGTADQNPQSAFVFYDPPLAQPAAVVLVNQQQASLSWRDADPASRIFGFSVNRDGSKLGTQQRPSATVTASSTASGDPAAVYANSASGSWSPATTPAWWEADLAQPVLLDGVSVSFGNQVSATISVRVQGTWVPIGQGQSFPAGTTTVLLSPALVANGLRVELPAPSGSVSLQHVDVVLSPAGAASPLIDAGLPPGLHSYRVGAVSPFGQSQTSGPVNAIVYQPVVSPPAAALANTSWTASGTAAPGSQVTIQGAASGASGAADSRGQFAVPVSLAQGSQQLTAQATDAAGNISMVSTPVTVTLDLSPAATLALTGQAAGTDALLTFTVSGDTSRIANLELLRAKGSGAPVSIARLSASSTNYIDHGLPAGNYAYTLRALNAHGFAGTPSAPVTVTIVAPALVAPTSLAVTPVSAGGALALSWSYASSSVGFLVERAQGAGQFVAINPASLASGLSFTDSPLQNGVSYTYRVSVVDAVGNRSAPSASATGTANAAVAPNAPAITGPTVADRPITVQSPTVAVDGTAHPGSIVELFVNDRSVGTATSTSTVVPSALTTSQPVGGSFDVSADGQIVAYVFTPPGSANGRVAIENTATSRVVTVADAQIKFIGVALSPDGAHAALVGLSLADNHAYIYVADANSGTIQRLTPALSGADQLEPAWSPDSSRLVYLTTVSGAQAVASAALADGAQQVLANAPPSVYASPRWASSSSVVALVQQRLGNTITRFDLGSGATEDVYVSAGSLSEPLAVSPNGTWLATIEQAAGGSNLVTVDLRALTTASLALQGNAFTPVFSPDGSKVAVEEGGNLAEIELASSAIDVLGAAHGPKGAGGNSPSDRLFWPKGGSPIFFEPGVGVARLSSGASFHFDSARLSAGDNQIYAAAHIGSAISGPSRAIDVTFDASTTPDLSVRLAVQPRLPMAGQPANAVVTVSNKGAATAVAPQVELMLQTNDGSLRSLPLLTLPGPVASGGQVTALVPLDLSNLSGQQTLTVVVAPAAAIADSDRSNNRATLNFMVASSPQVILNVQASPGAVSANGTSTVTATLANAGAAQTVSLHLELDDAGGVQTQALGDDTQVSLASGDPGELVQRSFNVGTLLAGTYQVKAVASANGQVVARGGALVKIMPDLTTQLSMVSDQAQAFSDQDIRYDLSIGNGSVNSILSGASLVFSVLDGQGNTVFTVSHALPTLARGASTSETESIPAHTLQPANYTAVANVMLGRDVLATTSAPLALQGRPHLIAQLAALVSPTHPSVPSGQPAVLHFVVSNIGDAAANGLNLHLAIIDPDTGSVMFDQPLALSTIAKAETDAGTVSAPTAGWALKGYAASLGSDSKDGSSTTTLATTSFRVADSTPPSIAVRYLADGAFVKGSILPTLEVKDDFSGAALVRASVDGATPVLFALRSGSPIDGMWNGALTLRPDGSHTLVFSAVDAEGNDGLLAATRTNPVTLHVVSDTLPPVLSISGVTDGELTNGAVTPLFRATDLNLDSFVATLNRQAFASGSTVQADGDYSLVVVAADKAGNQASQEVRFSIDTTPPDIQVFGVVDGEITNQIVTPTILTRDAHPSDAEATLDGIPFLTGTAVTTAGAHQLVINAVDLAGNASSKTVTFTLDFQPPVLTLSGVADGSYYNRDVAPTFSATDDDLIGVFGNLNGSAFSSGSVVTSEGDFTLVVSASDRAGNRASQTVHFTIDKTPPVVTVSGVTDGEVTKSSLAPVFTAQDANLASASATLNGAPFVSGTPVTAEGEYRLVVLAKDKASNATQVNVSFAIDRTPPVISISGVADGSEYDDAVTPLFTATDAHLATVTATLNGQTFASGTAVSDDGDYDLEIVAVDKAGNRSERAIRFSVLQVRYAVHLGPAAKWSRTLVFLDGQGCSSPADVQRWTTFLKASVGTGGAVLQIETNPIHALRDLRSGLYNVFARIGVRTGRDCDDDHEDRKERTGDEDRSPAQARWRLDHEVEELAYAGKLGVIAEGASESTFPHDLEEVLSAVPSHLVAASSVQFSGALAIQPKLSLGPKNVLIWPLKGAIAVALYPDARIGRGDSLGLSEGLNKDLCEECERRAVAGSLNTYGRGTAIALGFDLSLASPTGSATAAFAAAVSSVTPAEQPGLPLGLVGVQADLTNLAKGNVTRVRESFLRPLVGLAGVPAPTSSKPELFEWQFPLARDQETSLEFLMRLPDQAGNFAANTEVAALRPSGAKVWGNVPFVVTVGKDASGLHADAWNAVVALIAKGPVKHKRRKLENLLTGLSKQPIRTIADVECNLKRLLEAAEIARTLPANEVDSVRRPIDELIRYWEARWYAY